MEVDFSPETEAKLNRAAEENGSGSAEYVRQLVEQDLDYDSWFRQKVNKGLEQLDAGQYLTHEDLDCFQVDDDRLGMLAGASGFLVR